MVNSLGNFQFPLDPLKQLNQSTTGLNSSTKPDANQSIFSQQAATPTLTNLNQPAANLADQLGQPVKNVQAPNAGQATPNATPGAENAQTVFLAPKNGAANAAANAAAPPPGAKVFKVQEVDNNFNPTNDQGTYYDLNGDGMLNQDELLKQDGKGGTLDQNSPEYQARAAKYGQQEVLTDLDADGKLSADEYVNQDGKGGRTKDQQSYDARIQALAQLNPNLKPTNAVFNPNAFPGADPLAATAQNQTPEQLKQSADQMVQNYTTQPGADKAKADQLLQEFTQSLNDGDPTNDQAALQKLSQGLGVQVPTAQAANATGALAANVAGPGGATNSLLQAATLNPTGATQGNPAAAQKPSLSAQEGIARFNQTGQPVWNKAECPVCHGAGCKYCSDSVPPAATAPKPNTNALGLNTNALGNNQATLGLGLNLLV